MIQREIGIEEARKTLGDIVASVRHTGQSVILTKNGKPAARIVPVEIVTYYAVVVRGEQPGSLGEDLAGSEVETDAEIAEWAMANGVTSDDPDVWVLVTEDDEPEGELRNVIARKEFIRAAKG